MGGLGEVGGALCDLLQDHRKNVYVLDKKDDFNPPTKLKYDFLHVTIPYGSYFLRAVRKAMKKYKPRYVIIHSTVPVRTTKRLGKNVAHSPVRGNHPNLKDGLTRFVKYVGAEDVTTRVDCAYHLKECGMRVEAWEKAEDTELMKELCLSRLLNDLAFYEVAFNICKHYKVSPMKMIQWTYTYNDGYQGTKHKRAELSFPMGKVGGHCVIPVSRMLADQTRDGYLRKNLEVFEKSWAVFDAKA